MLEALCKTCEAREKYEPSEWFNHIWFLYALKRGGYPFKANDLTIDEWMDVGILSDEIESLNKLSFQG